MGEMSRPFAPPVLVLGFGILAVSASSIFIRYAQSEADSLAIAAWRLSLATLVLAPIALTRRRGELASLPWSERGLAALSGAFLAVHFASWITSLAYTSVASSVVLVSTAPLWVALLSPITLKEPLSRSMVAGLALALIGGAVVGLSDTCIWTTSGLSCPDVGTFIRGRAFIGDLLALVGAVAAAGYLIIGRRLRKQVSLLSYIFVVYGIAAIVLTLECDRCRTAFIWLFFYDLSVAAGLGPCTAAPRAHFLQLGTGLSLCGLRLNRSFRRAGQFINPGLFFA